MSIYEPNMNEFLMEDYGMTQNPDDVIERDFINAKSYLLSASERTGMNLYDHLASVLTKILAERPEDPLDVFEDYCDKEKRSRFMYKLDTFLEKKPKTLEVQLAEAQHKMFKKIAESDTDRDESDEPEVPNLQRLSFLLEQANLGLNREEMVRIWLAIKTLASTITGAARVRFWGKLFGLKSNYVVAEVDFKKDALVEESEETDENKADVHSISTRSNIQTQSFLRHIPAEAGGELYFLDRNSENPVMEQVMSQEIMVETNRSGGGDGKKETQEIINRGLGLDAPPLPQPFFLRLPTVPSEKPRVGVNKKAYYVCSAPGLPWTRLPNLTPQQISAARQIKKFLTGNLEAPIISYPLFPGKERNYLRAQIARISAGTHISPAGYYILDEEEEDEEDEDEERSAKGNIIINTEYEPLGVAELADPELENWVHHSMYILEQGRTKWWDLTPALAERKRQMKLKQKEMMGAGKKKALDEAGDEEEEAVEEEEEEEDEEEPLEPEEGPPMLTPLSEDQGLEGFSSWRTRLSSKLLPQFACAIVESNIWPGACAIANNKTFENIYIGWGHKFSIDSFNPTTAFELQNEYSMRDETDLTETNDPSQAEEEAWMKANKPGEDMDEENEEEEDDEDEEVEGGDEEDGKSERSESLPPEN